MVDKKDLQDLLKKKEYKVEIEISSLYYELFIIETLNGKHPCPYCEEFKRVQAHEKILNLIDLMIKSGDLKESGFSFTIRNVDWMDRVYNSKNDPVYSDYKLSTSGENWYYAQGCFVNGFPTIDFYIKATTKTKKEEKVFFKRFDAIGSPDPITKEFNITIVKDISNYFSQVLLNNAQEFEVLNYRNQGKVLYDAILDPKRKLII